MDKKERNIWWGPPRKFEDRLAERKISWLELFYDLVYVAAVAQLTHHIVLHPDWSSIGYVFFIFSLITWSWANGSYYHDAHGSEGIRTRYFTLIQMLAVAAITITLPDVFKGDHIGFSISFAIIQSIITFLWWSSGYYDPSHKKLNKYYVRFYPISIVLFIYSTYTDASTANILWACALAINYAVIFFSGPSVIKELKQRGIEFKMTSSMVERFGLFTIIVLGENILGIVNGISNVQYKSNITWLAFMLAILIVFLLWWVFFDMTGDSEVKSGYTNFLIHNTASLFLLGAFAVSGATISLLVSGVSGNLQPDVKYIFGVAVTIILSCIYFISSTLQTEQEEKYLMNKFRSMVGVTAIAVLFATVFSYAMNSLQYLILITIILAIPVYLGTRIWARYKIFNEEKNNNVT